MANKRKAKKAAKRPSKKALAAKRAAAAEREQESCRALAGMLALEALCRSGGPVTCQYIGGGFTVEAGGVARNADFISDAARHVVVDLTEQLERQAQLLKDDFGRISEIAAPLDFEDVEDDE